MLDSPRNIYSPARRLNASPWTLGALAFALIVSFAFMFAIGEIKGRRQATQAEAAAACAQGNSQICEAVVAIRAANAADDIVDLAVWQFWAGLVGIVFVGLTLKATRDAVKEANEATKAAQDAVDVTRDLGIAELRGYLEFDAVVEFGANRKLVKNTMFDTYREEDVDWGLNTILSCKVTGNTHIRSIVIGTKVRYIANGVRLSPFFRNGIERFNFGHEVHDSFTVAACGEQPLPPPSPNSVSALTFVRSRHVIFDGSEILTFCCFEHFGAHTPESHPGKRLLRYRSRRVMPEHQRKSRRAWRTSRQSDLVRPREG